MDECSGGDIDAWVALTRLNALLDDHLDAALRAEVDLALAEHEVLVQLVKGGGLLQMGDVARSLVLSKSGATRLVGKLEEQGLVERFTFPEDRRATFARLTESGRDVLARSRPVFDRVMSEHFTRHLTPTEIESLQRILGKVLAAQQWSPPSVCLQEWASPLVAVDERPAARQPASSRRR